MCCGYFFSAFSASAKPANGPWCNAVFASAAPAVCAQAIVPEFKAQQRVDRRIEKIRQLHDRSKAPAAKAAPPICIPRRTVTPSTSESCSCVRRDAPGDTRGCSPQALILHRLLAHYYRTVQARMEPTSHTIRTEITHTVSMNPPHSKAAGRACCTSGGFFVENLRQHRTNEVVGRRMDFSSDANADFEGLLEVNRGICMPPHGRKRRRRTRRRIVRWCPYSFGSA